MLCRTYMLCIYVLDVFIVFMYVCSFYRTNIKHLLYSYCILKPNESYLYLTFTAIKYKKFVRKKVKNRSMKLKSKFRKFYVTSGSKFSYYIRGSKTIIEILHCVVSIS